MINPDKLKTYFNKQFSFYTKLAKTYPQYSELYLYYMGEARAYLDLFQDTYKLLPALKEGE